MATVVSKEGPLSPAAGTANDRSPTDEGVSTTPLSAAGPSPTSPNVDGGDLKASSVATVPGGGQHVRDTLERVAASDSRAALVPGGGAEQQNIEILVAPTVKDPSGNGPLAQKRAVPPHESADADAAACAALSAQNPSFRPGVFEEPRFSPVTDLKQRTIAVGGDELAKCLGPAIRDQMSRNNVDRMVFVNEFLNHFDRMRATNPAVKPFDALNSFHIDSSAMPARYNGTNCVGLAQTALGTGRYAASAWLIGGEVPVDDRIQGVTPVKHVAAVVPFASPSNPKDRGFVFIDGPFCPGVPVVLRPGAKPVVMRQEGWREIHHIYQTKDGSQIILERHPFGSKLTPDEVRAKQITFKVERYDNPDNAITLPILVSDDRPFLYGFGPDGNIAAVVTVNLKKRCVEITVDDRRFEPVAFDKIDAGGKWLRAALPGGVKGLVKKLHLDSADELTKRVHQIVAAERTLLALRIEFLRKCRS